MTISQLELALKQLIERHSMLRAHIAYTDEGAVFQFNRQRAVEIEIINVDSWPAEAVTQYLNAVREVPFVLGNTSLWRLVLLTRSENESILVGIFHSIICDEKSLGIFFSDLGVLYLSRDGDMGRALNPLTRDYSHYVDRQKTASTGTEAKRHLAFWHEVIPNGLPSLHLPTIGYDTRESAAVSRAHYIWVLPAKLANQIREFLKRRDVSEQSLLLAAYQILLLRYTNQQEISVGIVVDTRIDGDFSGVLGCFYNLLPIVGNGSDNPAACLFLQQTMQHVQAGMEHRDFPHSACELDDNLTEAVPFQAIMSYREAECFHGLAPVLSGHLPQTAQWADCLVESLDVPLKKSTTDVEFSVVHGNEYFLCSLQSKPGGLPQELIVPMAKHFEMLLEAITTNSETRIGNLTMLTAAECTKLLAWTETRVDYSKEYAVHHLFERQALRTPSAIALVFEDQSLNYQQLNERSNQLAHHLRAQGMGPDMLVGICVERSIEMIVGLFGILKAGAAYVPIDLHLPGERINAIIADTQMALLLVDEKTVLPGQICVPLLYVDRDWDSSIANLEIRAVSNSASIDSLAYVIYTSGSTGQPKGIMYKHEGLSNHIHWMLERYPLTTTDNVLHKSPCTFDVSTWEIFWTLSAGAKVVIAKHDGHHDVFYLKRTIEQERITIINFVPSMLQLFVDFPTTHDLSSLRLTLCSGEVLKSSLVDQFLDLCEKCEIHDLYGPSETEVVTACRRTHRKEGGIANIGKPTANARLYVLDKQRQFVPIGVAGELYIGGPRLARGYLNSPELTATSFVKDPFSDESEAKLYRSGDFVRWLPDGSLDFIGRSDGQIKLHGLRVELGEIDALLSQHPDVRQCAVVAREDINGNKRLIAYIVLASSASAMSQPFSCHATTQWNGGFASCTRQMDPKWYSYLVSKLPEPMVPRTYIIMTAFPVTFSGKLDLKALPKPSTERPSVESSLVLPSSQTEQIIARVWRDLLQLDVVGIDDGFFELGGHSLLALQVQSRLGRELGQHLPATTLLQHATIRTLARYIDCLQSAAPELVKAHGSGRKLIERVIAHKQRRASDASDNGIIPEYRDE